MGIIQDLATLVGNGVTVDMIKDVIEIEKGKADGQSGAQTGTEIPANEADGAEKDEGTEDAEPDAKPEADASVQTSIEIENLRKELEDSKKLISELQQANRNRNQDDGSTKSDEDLLNDIMLEMF